MALRPEQIIRSVPGTDDLDGYLDPRLFEQLGIVQTVSAAGTVYVSGIAPLRGGTDGVEPVADTMAGQLRFVLDVLDSSLSAAGTSRAGLVAWTIYTTDIAALAGANDIIRRWAGADRPTSTWIGVSGFIHPAQLIELTATAVIVE